VYGKHLCGKATDLSLKLLLVSFASLQDLPFEKKWLAFAPCCHHLCTREEYVNPSFLESYGISADLFPALIKMSSWATISPNNKVSFCTQASRN
jgi:tRNA:m4X modification enzyme